MGFEVYWKDKDKIRYLRRISYFVIKKIYRNEYYIDLYYLRYRHNYKYNTYIKYNKYCRRKFKCQCKNILYKSINLENYEDNFPKKIRY